MNWALLSLALPLACGLQMLLFDRRSGLLVVVVSLASLGAAAFAVQEVVNNGDVYINLGGWDAPLAIRLHLMPVSAVLLAFTALIHTLVAFYALGSRHSKMRDTDYWPLSCLLHASLAALWLSNDVFNWYITLELLGLVSVALITLSGPKAYAPALNYLMLSLAASLCYLLGVALLYGQYGVLDLELLADQVRTNTTTRTALLLMTLGLMLKAALWPLHLWLPGAHAGAPTAVSALLSALVIKGPLFILWRLWTQLAPAELAQDAGFVMALAGIAALLSGGWSALRAPYIKVLVAYSTVAQLGYALLALGLMLHWQHPELHLALWFFVIAHGLAKVSMFLAAGEMQATLNRKGVAALKGATQTMPVAMFAYAVAGGSLIGIPPSGGFLAKWELLQPILQVPAHWPWAFGILLGTLASALYVFRGVVLAFERVPVSARPLNADPLAQWLAMLPALLVWGMALVSNPLMRWLTGGPS
jgi:formate hydrogenlyase subunit 3/multisubunit Na+/H+ antiporter MnhD subunit